MTNYYTILGVPENATDEEVKAAYRKLCLKYHPDHSKLPNAAEMFRTIEEAYTFLSDPVNRRILDENLREQERMDFEDYMQQTYQRQAEDAEYATQEQTVYTETNPPKEEKKNTDSKIDKIILGILASIPVGLIVLPMLGGIGSLSLDDLKVSSPAQIPGMLLMIAFPIVIAYLFIRGLFKKEEA